MSFIIEYGRIFVKEFMVASVLTTSGNALYAVFISPLSELAARVSHAFNGVDIHKIDHPKIGLGERLVDVMAAFSLLLPVVGFVVFCFMRTFGSPLSLPAGPANLEPWKEAEAVASRVIVPPVDYAKLIEEPAPKENIHRFQYHDWVDGKDKGITDWEIVSRKKVHTVTKKARSEKEASRGIYDSRWNQVGFTWESAEYQARIEITREDNVLKIEGTREKEKISKEFVLENPQYPWIQQVSVGIRKFVLAEDGPKELVFYSVNPESISLSDVKVTKEASELPEYGPVVLVKLKANSGIKSLMGTVAEYWFDPKTGDLIQEKWDVDLGVFSYTSETKIVK
jgi:hypothetical protein